MKPNGSPQASCLHLNAIGGRIGKTPCAPSSRRTATPYQICPEGRRGTAQHQRHNLKPRQNFQHCRQWGSEIQKRAEAPQASRQPSCGTGFLAFSGSPDRSVSLQLTRAPGRDAVWAKLMPSEAVTGSRAARPGFGSIPHQTSPQQPRNALAAAGSGHDPAIAARTSGSVTGSATVKLPSCRPGPSVHCRCETR